MLLAVGILIVLKLLVYSADARPYSSNYTIPVAKSRVLCIERVSDAVL